MSINSALSMSVNALQVNQLALNVVSNNVANMNTDGYSKQRVNLGTMSIGGSVSGSAFNQIASNAGVQITSISRYSNEYLASYYRQQNSSLSFYSTESEIADHITTLMDELSDGGLSTAFDEFYAAATTLQQTPTDATARHNYIQKAKNVAILFNTKSKDLSEYRTTLVGDGTQASLNASQAADNVNKINTMLDDLAAINKRIVASGTVNSAANNLYDQRDILLSEISNYLNIDTSIAENGVASVTLGGIDLVKHTEVLNRLEIRAEAPADDNVRAIVGLVDEEGNRTYSNINDKITGGSLGAILEMGSNAEGKLTVQGALDSLDELARGFAETLNAIQLQGWQINQTTGEYEPDDSGLYAMAVGVDANGEKVLASPSQPIFNITNEGINARNITVNSALIEDPSGIAAATVSVDKADLVQETIDGQLKYTLNSDDKYGVGNGKNMINVLSTREKTENSTLNNLSPEEYLMTAVTNIGLQAESINNQATAQNAICNSVTTQLQSQTTVDLNEELTDMIKYQRSYQAAARVFNTCSEILGVLVTLGQ